MTKVETAQATKKDLQPDLISVWNLQGPTVTDFLAGYPVAPDREIEKHANGVFKPKDGVDNSSLKEGFSSLAASLRYELTQEDRYKLDRKVIRSESEDINPKRGSFQWTAAMFEGAEDKLKEVGMESYDLFGDWDTNPEAQLQVIDAFKKATAGTVASHAYEESRKVRGQNRTVSIETAQVAINTYAELEELESKIQAKLGSQNQVEASQRVGQIVKRIPLAAVTLPVITGLLISACSGNEGHAPTQTDIDAEENQPKSTEAIPAVSNLTLEIANNAVSDWSKFIVKGEATDAELRATKFDWVKDSSDPTELVTINPQETEKWTIGTASVETPDGSMSLPVLMIYDPAEAELQGADYEPGVYGLFQDEDLSSKGRSVFRAGVVKDNYLSFTGEQLVKNYEVDSETGEETIESIDFKGVRLEMADEDNPTPAPTDLPPGLADRLVGFFTGAGPGQASEPTATPTEVKPTATSTSEPTPKPTETPAREVQLLENWEDMGVAIDGVVISERIISFNNLQIEDEAYAFQMYSVVHIYPGIVIGFQEISPGVFENWIGIIINGKNYEFVAYSAEGRLKAKGNEFDTLTEYIDADDIENGISWSHGLRGLVRELDSDYLDKLKIEQPSLYQVLQGLVADPNQFEYLENFFKYGTIPQEWVDKKIYENGRLDFRNLFAFIGS